MRTFLVALLMALALALPAMASGDKQAPGTGSLVVQDGRGVVSVALKGGIIGRFDSGQITVDWQGGPDAKAPIVFGAEKIRPLGAHRTTYIGNDVHFYYGGSYRVQVIATGINLSAVGKGNASLGSTGFLDPGFYRVDDGPLTPIPDFPVRVRLGSA